MDSGILFVAVGHHNYGHMAANCAASCKLQSPEYPRALVCTENVANTIGSAKRAIFDEIKIISEDLYVRDGHKYFGLSKLNLYNLSPFQNTVFIDADSFVSPLRNLDELMSYPERLGFWVTNYSIAEGTLGWASFWGDVSKYADHLKFKGNRYCTGVQSSIIAFDKSAKSKEIFDNSILAHETIRENKLEYNSIWFNSIADELCFTCGLFMSEYIPAVINNMLYAVYTTTVVPSNQWKEIQAKHTIITFATGGGKMHSTSQNAYNQLANYYCTRAKIAPYHWKTKNTFNMNSIKKH